MTNKQGLNERDGHPSARLAEALARANGILGVLSQCYDSGRGGFAVTDGFVIQSVAAIETFVCEAQAALAELSLKADVATPVEAAPLPKTFAIETRGAPSFSIADADQSEDAQVFEVGGAESTVEQETRAHSYDELLRKVTAAEVFAQEQQAQTDGTSNSLLLPLLRSLKEDLKKVRAA